MINFMYRSIRDPVGYSGYRVLERKSKNTSTPDVLSALGALRVLTFVFREQLLWQPYIVGHLVPGRPVV